MNRLTRTIGAKGFTARWPRQISRPWLVAALAITGMVLAGCGEGGTPAAGEPSEAEAAAPAEPRSGGTLVVATLSDAGRLDPHTVTDAASMRVIENLYSTLLRYGEAYGDFESDLAASVAPSDDGLTYTIKLVPNATFHSGRPVTAEAVKFSIERIIDRKVRAQQFAAVETIETPDPQTVILKLSEPVAPMLSYLAYPMNAIVDPQVVEEAGGTLDSLDAGSGPFKLAEWQRDRRIVLERHDGYHVEGLPRLDRVEIRPMPDATARTTALRTGEVHLLTEVAPKDAAILDGASGVVVKSVPGTFWEYIGLNCRKPPFDKLEARQAVAEGIDRAMLNKLVKFGRATVLTGGNIPPNHWADAKLDTYAKPDRDKARQLLASAGLADGAAVELIVDSGVAYQVRAAEVLKQQLKPIGLDVTIRGLESAVFFDRLGKGDFQMTVVGWMGFVDPDEWTWNLFHSEGKYNQQGFANAKLDGLLDRGRREIDREQRKALYAEAQQIIAREAPMVFLYVNDQASAWRDSVHGYYVHPTATTLALRDAWLAD